MSSEREIFGTTASGETVYRVELRGGGLRAKVLTWGSVIQDLRLDGHAPPLVLGFESFEPYPLHSPYFGASPGRNANRIANGRFMLDGHEVQLDHCEITATYHLRDDGVLSVIYDSTTDAPTPVNVCQHSYFNLDGRDDALGHDLMIAADHYLPTNEAQVPTGELRPVVGTPFDFRQMSPMKRVENGEQVLFDHNFCLSRARMPKRPVALARSLNSGVTLEVRTSEPGVQFYAGFKVNAPVPGLDGRRYGPFAGFCLETQVWPDAVNHADFPPSILRPGETLRQETDYVFSKS